MELSAEQLATYKVDRTNWQAGPWDGEPDRLQWTHAGFACLMVRHPRMGNWCAYVGVDRAHPLYGKHPLHGDADEVFERLEPARQLNYGDFCDGVICHAPEPGLPAEVWWLGMDFAHAFDRVPGAEARERAQDSRNPTLAALSQQIEEHLRKFPLMRPRYAHQASVQKATEALAEQLRALAPGQP